jgi:hypothetical protein
MQILGKIWDSCVLPHQQGLLYFLFQQHVHNAHPQARTPAILINKFATMWPLTIWGLSSTCKVISFVSRGMSTICAHPNMPKKPQSHLVFYAWAMQKWPPSPKPAPHEFFKQVRRIICHWTQWAKWHGQFKNHPFLKHHHSVAAPS